MHCALWSSLSSSWSWSSLSWLLLVPVDFSADGILSSVPASLLDNSTELDLLQDAADLAIAIALSCSYFSKLYFMQLYFSKHYFSKSYFSRLYIWGLYFPKLYFSYLHFPNCIFPNCTFPNFILTLFFQTVFFAVYPVYTSS